MRKDTSFGTYRTTPATIWRQASAAFRPRYQVTRAVHDHLAAMARADQDLRRFQADEATARRLLRDALSRNAYGTASIEGGPLTLAEVESLLAAAPTQDRVEVPDEREILNYARFVEAIPATRPPTSLREVRAMHRQLFQGVLPGPGRFKAKPNFVARRATREVVYVPTRPDRVEVELQAALDWLHGAEEHPVVRTMAFFHEFQSIHPFADGNGRLGRAITTLLLWHQGYEGVRYALVDYALNEDRDAYYAQLDAARSPRWDLTPWLGYMAGVLRATFEGAVQRFLFAEGLPPSLNARQVRLAEWAARLDRGNPGRRLKFNDLHAGLPEVPRRTLQLDLRRLVEAGVLLREGERKATTYQLARGTPQGGSAARRRAARR